jgi:integrase
MFLTYYDTGMRKSELRLLHRSRLDLDRTAIRLQAEDTKTGRPRIVPLTDRVVEAIRSLPTPLGKEHVFVNPETGKPWDDPYKLFKKVCGSLRIEGVWLHDTRRSFSTNARRRGSSESEVMKVTGHTTRSTFDRYNIVDEEDAREVIRRLEAGAATELARTPRKLRQDSVKMLDYGDA